MTAVAEPRVLTVTEELYLSAAARVLPVWVVWQRLRSAVLDALAALADPFDWDVD